MPEKIKIVGAEDDPNDALLLDRAFSKTGINIPIRFVKDGQEAVDYLGHTDDAESTGEEPSPELLVLDLKMPRLNGFEVLEWLRNHPDLRRRLVVVFSSSDLHEDMEKAYALGAASYLVKPLDPEGYLKVAKALQEQLLRFSSVEEVAAES
jgi:CheY-like chemotaxis protein